MVESIKAQTLLLFPDFSKEFQLHTDASDGAIGAVLQQDKYIIGFFSKKLTMSQRNYTVTEKEFFAISQSLKFFRNIIFGTEIKIHIDHHGNIFESSNLSSRIQR
jgi:hypothetical protein